MAWVAAASISPTLATGEAGTNPSDETLWVSADISAYEMVL